VIKYLSSLPLNIFSLTFFLADLFLTTLPTSGNVEFETWINKVREKTQITVLLKHRQDKIKKKRVI